MASVPNMRLTPAPATGGEGKGHGDGETAGTGFASLLATGAPAGIEAPHGAPEGGPARRTVADLLAAIQRAIGGRTAPASTGDTNAADDDAAPSDGKDAKAGDGKSDDPAGADASASPADLIPVIEAQSAAPVSVATPPAPTPQTPPATKIEAANVPASAEKTLPRGAGDGRHPSVVKTAETVKAAAASAPAEAAGSLAAALVQASAALPAPAAPAPGKAPSLKEALGRIGIQTEAPSRATTPGAPPADPQAGADSETPQGDGKPAASVPVPQPTGPTAKAAPDTPVARPDAKALGQGRAQGQGQPQAQAQTQAPAPAATDPRQPAPAAVVQPFSAPDAAAAIQAAMGAIADKIAAPQAAPADGSAQQAPIADRVMTHQLDLARDSAWLDRLARDIASAGAADGPMRFRLHPESLGHMHVELTQSDRGTSVRLTVDNETARGIIADAQPKLVAEARAQGVRIAETHVDLAGGSGGQASGDPRRQADLREPMFLRTASGRAGEGEPSPAPRRGGGSDRYA